MKEKNFDFVIPGDHLSFPEEYLSGKNTSESDYRIISVSYGSLNRDEKSLTVSVECKDKCILIENNDVVYGQVTKSDSRQISISIVGVAKNHKVFHFSAEGYLRMNHDRRSNGRNFKPVMIGDLLRARVLRAGQFSELTIDGNGLGVLKSRCSNCRDVLILKDGNLFCVNCNKWEGRKNAPDYGTPILGER